MTRTIVPVRERACVVAIGNSAFQLQMISGLTTVSDF
jgi:hypothetical protein